MKDLETKALRFPFAGRFTIILQAENGMDSTDPKDIYTSGRNIVEQINFSSSRTEEQLNDGNSLYPAAIYPTGKTDNVAIVLNSEDPDLDMFIKGAIKSTPENVPQWHTNISRVIDGDKILIKDSAGNAVKISEDMPPLVRDFMTNKDYKYTKEVAPNTGEFTVDFGSGEFEFSEADKGKRVLISCGLIVPEATVYTETTQPKSRTFRVIVTGPAEDYTANNPLYVTKDFDSMQPAGDYSPLAQQKNPGQKTLNLQTTRPRGTDAVKTTYSKRVIDD